MASTSPGRVSGPSNTENTPRPAPIPRHLLSTPITTRTPLGPLDTPSPNASPSIANTQKRRQQYKGGYASKPQTPSSRPFALNSRGLPTQRPFVVEGLPDVRIVAHDPLERGEWQVKALEAGLLAEGQSLRDFQVETANWVIARKGDLVLLAPTGQGKSLSWMLPLLVQPGGISLVVTPYQSLGKEGQEKHHGVGQRAVFIFSEEKSPSLLQDIAAGLFSVLYICPEMLEGRTFQPVLHSSHFKQRLSAIYLDESHLARESDTWRPAMTRLHQLRVVVGEHIPMIALTATGPTAHREALVQYAGLRPDYRLINLGNYRPELSMVVLPMHFDVSSCLDLGFLLREGSRATDLEKTIIYSDNIERLTIIFWWFTMRLRSMGVSESLVDIIHAGLSTKHQDAAMEDFKAGRTKFLLGTEKIANGINPGPGVQRVVQYGVRNCSICQLLQKVGRMARLRGETGTAYVMVEESMQQKSGLSVRNPEGQDPALLELIHNHESSTPVCCDIILDRALENPPRPTNLARVAPCCSVCHPELLPGREYQFVMVDSSKYAREGETVDVEKAEREKIVKELQSWRLETWQNKWRQRYRQHGPRALIPDSTLTNLARNAAAIKSVDDMRPLVQLPFWRELSQPLFEALTTTYRRVCKIPETPSSDPPPPPSTTDTGSHPSVLDVLDNPSLASQLPQKRSRAEDQVEASAPPARRKRGRPAGVKELAPPQPIAYEQVFNGDMVQQR